MLYLWSVLLILLNALWLVLVVFGLPGNWLIVISTWICSSRSLLDKKCLEIGLSGGGFQDMVTDYYAVLTTSDKGTERPKGH